MKSLSIENVLKACGGQLFYGDGVDLASQAQDVVIDSRKASTGSVFVASKGERVDGHKFIPQVFENGALLCICQDVPDKNYGPCIKVDDPFDALRKIAEFYRTQLDVKVVGITGSVGKTTTKEFVAGVLSKKYNVLKTAGNLNNTIGLPLTILSIREEHDIAVVEMGINQFHEMSLLSKIAKPDIAVITNIGDCHLEALIDRDGVLRAKTEIFEYMNNEGTVVINVDDDKLATIDAVNGKTPISFAIENTAMYRANNIVSNGLFGSQCDIECDNIIVHADIPLPGRHMIYNAMTATIVARIFDMEVADIEAGLKSIDGVGGRSNVIRTSQYVLIDDCYNANPTSVKAAVDMLMNATGRRVAILGDMYELGENEAALHYETGVYAATKGVECIICIGELSKNMYDGAIETGGNAFYFNTKEEALDNLARILEPQDTILIKASHGMAFEEIVKWLSKA